jgi:hypothetical protein
MLPSKLNTQPPQNSIDFFSELSKIMQTTSSSSCSPYESSNIVISSSPPSNDENICLISKENLHPNHITLKCNHKFNYMPIYKEVLYQKTKSNTMYEVTKLQPYQIKCPYCRTITNKLLPFIPYPSVKLAKNIHSTGSDCLSAKKCSYIIKTRATNSSTTCDSNCHKNALYYEAENLLLCPGHYKKHIAKSPIGATKVEKVSTKPRCTATLKSGVNIGKPCNSIISIDGSQFCKRHSHSQSQ